MKKIFTILCALVYIITCKAQYQGEVYKSTLAPLVINNTDTITNAWQGGMNSVQLQMADLNNDAKKDIVIYDFINGYVFTFLHYTNNGINSFKYEPLYAKNFPINYNSPIRGYLLLRDFNCDNIPDLFTRGQFGVAVLKGSYLGNQLQFTPYTNLFFPGTFGPVNVYVQPGDVPVIDDIDNDGDLDILAFDVAGTVLNYYKNIQVEQNLPCDSIKMTFAENCWGKFTQGGYRSAFLNINCKGFEAIDTIYPNIDKEVIFEQINTQIATKKATRHTGNCLLTFDADNDADKDLIIGGTGFPDLNLLTNGGTANFANITSQDTIYNSATGNKIFLPSWACSSFEDADGDGKRDLICGTHIEKNGSQDCETKQLQFYKNTGTNTLPNFTTGVNNFLFNKILDFGTYSFPTFFDVDKDGLQDLIVGSEGELDTSTYKHAAKLFYYKNTSSLGTISFSLQSNNYANIASKKYNGLYPHFTDVTGDSITDLILGSNNGKLILYKNMAASNLVSPNFVWQTDSFLNADVGNYCAPTSADINKDGKTDLIIGNELGKLIYYEDTSTQVGIKSYYKISNNLGGIEAGGNNNFLGYASPTFAKVDNSRKEILLVGTGDGTIERYDSLYAPIYGPYVRTDSFYSLIQTPFRTVPAVADINNDGYYDMIIGNKLGGLQLYNQVLLVDTVAGVPASINTTKSNQKYFNVYPNPTKNIINIQGLLNNYGAIEFTLYNMAGQIVAQQNFANADFQQYNMQALQNGLYSYKIITKKLVQTGTILKHE